MARCASGYPLDLVGGCTAPPIPRKESRYCMGENKKRKRNIQRLFRFTEAESSRFEEAYSRSGVKSKGQFVLQLLEGRPIIDFTELIPLRRELARQGTNLNQLARVANEMGYLGEELRDAIRKNNQLKAEIDQIVKEAHKRRTRRTKQ